MTHQQELELLAEWLGLEWGVINDRFMVKKHDDFGACGTYGCTKHQFYPWNPSPEGNDTDFLNMVAGRVWIRGNDTEFYVHTTDGQHDCREYVKDHNNDKLAAMKHAAYQVCLMAAKEWKEGK